MQFLEVEMSPISTSYSNEVLDTHWKGDLASLHVNYNFVQAPPVGGVFISGCSSAQPCTVWFRSFSLPSLL